MCKQYLQKEKVVKTNNKVLLNQEHSSKKADSGGFLLNDEYSNAQYAHFGQFLNIRSKAHQSQFVLLVSDKVNHFWGYKDKEIIEKTIS